MSTRSQAITAIALVCVTMYGCDYGMTIRQRTANQPADQDAQAGDVDIRVEPSHPLTGEDWYVPQVTVTNRRTVNITVTAAELVGPSGTTPNDPGDVSHLPEEVPANQIGTIAPYFRLRNPVSKEFVGEVELRIYFTTDGKDRFERVVVLEGAR